jgi:hypothetical protein
VAPVEIGSLDLDLDIKAILLELLTGIHPSTLAAVPALGARS